MEWFHPYHIDITLMKGACLVGRMAAKYSFVLQIDMHDRGGLFYIVFEIIQIRKESNHLRKQMLFFESWFSDFLLALFFDVFGGRLNTLTGNLKFCF